MKALLIAPLMLTAVPALAEDAHPRVGEETSIPFADRDGIQDYKADADRGLYIRSITGEWYYARTMGKCARLQSANAIGFATAPGGKLDRTGALVAQGWRCQLDSLTRSEAPPKKAKRDS
jgi:hypothetical protein